MGRVLDYKPRGWTEEECLVVKAMVQRGMSATEISRQLRGRTRNAVLGLMHRNGWTKQGRAKLRSIHARPVPVKRALAAAQLTYDTSIEAITLAGPAWSWPANARAA
jgi:hypothetical protein